MTGKLNQVIPPAPLHPITVTGGAFERVIIDCVLFSTFRLPRTAQTDQRSNFQSKMFKQVLQTLNVQRAVSSVYNPESQGRTRTMADPKVHSPLILFGQTEKLG